MVAAVVLLIVVVFVRFHIDILKKKLARDSTGKEEFTLVTILVHTVSHIDKPREAKDWSSTHILHIYYTYYVHRKNGEMLVLSSVSSLYLLSPRTSAHVGCFFSNKFCLS